MPDRPELPFRKTARPDRREILAAVGLTLAAGAGFAGPGAIAGPAVAQKSDRIVALGGVVTEVLYALGLQDRIVGVDTTSQFPPEALRDKPGVGYVRALSVEGVLSLRPSLVIAIEGAGPPDAIALLREAGVRLVVISEDLSTRGVAARIGAIGAAAGAGEPARRLAETVQAGFEELAALRARVVGKRRVLFALSLQNGRTMVGGANSTADAMIRLAGGVNAAAGVEGYKPMTDEAVIAAAPEVVLMMRNSSGHDATPEELFAMPAFSATPAAGARALVRMDGLYLLGFGPRAPLAARDLMAAIHPDAAIPALKTAAAP